MAAKISRKKLELLAPAGDSERLKYAFAYGADTVYLGLPEFSLRARTGFDFASLKAAIAGAHQAGKRVYVTVNIFAHQSQIEALPGFLKQLNLCRPDAVILSDPGVLLLVKKYLPRTPIHLSTQANTLNAEAVKFWRQNGVKRIILGREASLADIKRIRVCEPKMELEVFVHGAMCLSYSGRCYLSAELFGRSANLGACTQPCRFKYNLYAEEPTMPGRHFPIEEDGGGMYFMNSKDLCLIEYLPQLIKAGVNSFKIEGRTKSNYYVAAVVGAYHAVLSAPENKKILAQAKAELDKIDSREYCAGFMFPADATKRQNYQSSKSASDWQLAGEIVETLPGKAVIKIHNSLKAGESVELLTPAKIHRFTVKALIDGEGRPVAEAHGGTQKLFTIDLPRNCRAAYGLIRKRK